MQAFITSIEIDNSSTVYYQIYGTKKPHQGALLCAELHLDIIMQAGGGYSAFEEDYGSYIITTKSEYQSKPTSEYIKLVKSSGEYVLLYNSAT